MNEVLVRTIMNFLHFLDSCDEDVLDDDQAVSLQEEIAAILSELGAKDRTQLSKVMSSVAKAETDTGRKASFSSMFENLGLAD